MTDTDDLTGWRLVLAMLVGVAFVAGIYVAARVVLWAVTR